MRNNWARAGRTVAVLLLLTIIGVADVQADDPPNPYEPPEARIRPPIGIASEARIGPSMFEIVMSWVRAQMRNRALTMAGG